MAIALPLLALAGTSQARDDIGKYSIQDLLKTEQAKNYLLDIPLYFGKQSHGKAVKTFGEVSTNKKTNAFNKSDTEACQHVMLSALKALQDRARREGMNAVVNIVSQYKKRDFTSETEFECGAGTFMAGVSLRGSLVTIDKK